jgi:hypothetical protein
VSSDGRTAFGSEERDRSEPDAPSDRPLVSSAEALLNQSRRHDEGRTREREQCPARPRSRRVRQVAKPLRCHRSVQRLDPSGRRKNQRQCGREPREHHEQLQRVHPGGTKQPASGEIHGHDAATEQCAQPTRHAGQDLKDRGAGNQLAGEQCEGAEPDQYRRGHAHTRAEAKLEVIAGRVEIVRLCHPPHARRHGRREHERAESRGAHPPPGADAVPVGETGGSDRRPGTDVGREHRREDQSRAQAPPRDEERGAAPHLPCAPDAQRDDDDRVDDEKREVKAHRRRAGTVPRSRAEGRPPEPAARAAARTIASAITSAASAPITVTLTSPSQRPVASENTVSPSPTV